MNTEITKSNMTAFDIAETKERNVLTKLFAAKGITEYEFTPIGSCLRHDFEFTKDGKKYIGDIKCRNIKSTSYKDSLVNKKKVDYLLEQGYKTDKIPLFIAYYDDGVAACWSLMKERREMVQTTKSCTRTTSGTTAWDAERFDNPVVLLKLVNASKNQVEL